MLCKYCRVASSNTSHLEPHPGLLMKGIFDDYLCTVTFWQIIFFELKSIHWVLHKDLDFIKWQLMSALARLQRFGEKDPFFKKWRSCRNCLQSDWALVNALILTNLQYLERFGFNCKRWLLIMTGQGWHHQPKNVNKIPSISFIIWQKIK